MSNPLGTRKNPSRLRLLLIFIVMFIVAALIMWVTSSNDSGSGKDVTIVDTSAQPVAGCRRDGREVDCRDRWTSGPFSRENTERARKVVGGTVLGCAGGFAAGATPGAFYGCVGGFLGSLWGEQF